MYKQIVLKPKKESSLERFHPWVFSGAIAKLPTDVQEGEVVEIYSNKDEFIALGHYQVGSIAVRVLAFEKKIIDASFWEERLSAAYNHRKSIGLISSVNNSYRLVFGEGDNLSGLIIDVYDNTAVLQAHSVGMHQSREIIAKTLLQISEGAIKNVYYKSETTLPYKAELGAEDGYLIGSSDEKGVPTENELKFFSDWAKGQKTGFFLDQRDNRTLFEKYAKDRSVLNMFCYTGGFSFYAMRGGAKLVHSVDSSSRAVDLANENVNLNFPNDERHQSFVEDAFKFLGDLSEDKYNLMVLDPPAFAKHRGAIKNALNGYKRINTAALRKIEKGGILFTFSCSQAISKEQFRLAVFSAAAITGRSVKILHQLSQPADHPINIYHPEGEYLKGLVLYVD